MDSADLQTSTYCKGGRSTAEKSKSSKVSPSNCGCVINIMIVDTLVLMFDLLKNWSKKHLLSFCHSVSTLVFVIWKLVCVSVLKTLGVGMGPSQELALTRHWLGNFWKARTQISPDESRLGIDRTQSWDLVNFSNTFIDLLYSDSLFKRWGLNILRLGLARTWLFLTRTCSNSTFSDSTHH